VAQVKLPKWVQAFTRNGIRRHYFRRRGYPRVALPGEPWSTEFMAAYLAASEGQRIAYSGKAAPGSTAAVVLAYLASDHFKRIPSEQSRKTHRGILERFASRHGEKPFNMFDRRAVEVILERMPDTPGAARNLRNVLRRMCRWAVKEQFLTADPTEGIKVTMPKSEGWHTMTDDERYQFEARHPIGTKARAVYAVLFFTALRVSDASRLGPQHLRGDELVMRQHKTGDEVRLPVHPEMMKALRAAGPSTALAFLTTRFGLPYSAKGLSNAFKEWCREAGLPHCSAHSVRKGTLTMMADRGSQCSRNSGLRRPQEPQDGRELHPEARRPQARQGCSDSL
jgi:integrase/recombinase XerD